MCWANYEQLLRAIFHGQIFLHLSKKYLFWMFFWLKVGWIFTINCLLLYWRHLPARLLIMTLFIKVTQIKVHYTVAMFGQTFARYALRVCKNCETAAFDFCFTFVLIGRWVHWLPLLIHLFIFFISCVFDSLYIWGNIVKMLQN